MEKFKNCEDHEENGILSPCETCAECQEFLRQEIQKQQKEQQQYYSGTVDGTYIRLTYGHIEQIGPDGYDTPESILAYDLLCKGHSEGELDKFLNSSSGTWYGLFELNSGRQVALAGETDINNSTGKFLFAAEWDF